MNLQRYIVISVILHCIFIVFIAMYADTQAELDLPYQVSLVSSVEPPVPVKPVREPLKSKPLEKQQIPEKKPVPEVIAVPEPSVQLQPPAMMRDDLVQQSQAFVYKKTKPQESANVAEPGGSGAEKKGDLDESAVSATPRSAQGLLPPKQHTGNIIPPAALFDRNIIHKYAAREDPDKQDLSFTAPGFKNRGYMRMLKEKIERIWRYPNEAARSGISGDLYIKFTINKKGQIRDITLLRTSGFNVLDFAAMQALKDAEPYWPLPADWKDDTLEITGHFVYVYGR